VVILLFGPPGSGKGTQGRLIIDWLPVPVPSISTGEMLREEIAAGTPLGRQTKAVIASGGLVSDDIINEIVERRVSRADCRDGFLLDGYPRTLNQARYLDNLLARHGLPAPVVLHLDVHTDALVSRIICRRQCFACGQMYNVVSKRPKSPGRCDSCGGALTVRRDDREEVIRERLKAYDDQTRPILAHYTRGNYCHIEGDRSPKYIFESITRHLEQYLPVAATR
jgi:adenylate kinase